jgi:hypothetical protein
VLRAAKVTGLLKLRGGGGVFSTRSVGLEIECSAGFHFFLNFGLLSARSYTAKPQ